MTQPDASASPVNPLTGKQPNIPGGMRSIYDRMTKPTPQDLQVNDRLAHLTRGELDRVITHLGQSLEYFAAQREDVQVQRTQDATSWTIRVEMKPNVPSPIVGQR